jgi:hypothetical protein
MCRIWDSLDDGKPEPTAFWTAPERVFLADGEKSDAILVIGISESAFQTADLPTRSTFFTIHNNMSSLSRNDAVRSAPVLGRSNVE